MRKPTSMALPVPLQSVPPGVRLSLCAKGRAVPTVAVSSSKGPEVTKSSAVLGRMRGPHGNSVTLLAHEDRRTGGTAGRWTARGPEMAKVDQAKETLWYGGRTGEVDISPPWETHGPFASRLRLWAVPEVPRT